jgi:pimeloyl-ACP methyl ester carboxylesterase
MMDRDISRVTLESFCLSIASLRRTDLRPQLNRVSVPVMGMYGAKDIVVHPRQWQPIHASLPEARIERYPQAGHFIMLDEPQLFMRDLHNFLAAEPENGTGLHPEASG